MLKAATNIPVPGNAEFFPNDENLLCIQIDGSLLSEAAFSSLTLSDPKVDLIRLAHAERGGDVLLVNTPDLVRSVLVGNHRSFVKGPEFQRIKMLTGNGVIVTDGAAWRAGRKIIQPAFVSSNWGVFQGWVDREADALARRWVDLALQGEEVDLLEEAEHFALNVLIGAVFSDDAGQFSTSDGGCDFDVLKGSGGKTLELAAQVHQLRASVLEAIQKRKAAPEGRRDILGLMLEARAARVPEVTDRAMVDEIVTLIVAGYETSAILLGWAWYLSGRAPDSLDWLRHGAGTLDARITSLAYECLRLYPPVWMFSRRATAPVALGPVTVETGDVVAISPYMLHRRPDIWDTPDAFRPDRFLNMEDSDPRWRAFIPFSAGPRRCIGDVFSDYEIRAVLSRLIDVVRVVPDPSEDISLAPLINLRSRVPLRARLRPVKEN